MCAWARKTLIVLLLTAALSGCGDSGGTATVAPTPDGPATAPAAPQVEVIALDSLPRVEDHVTTRGKHPIEVARPKDWVPAYTPKRLYATKLKNELTYPQISVTGEEYTGLEKVTAENVQQFAETIRKEQQGKVTKGPAPVQIGEFLGVSYTDKVRAGGDRLERLMLVTVHGGQKFTVELRARLGTLEGFAPQAQAVAGNIRFNPSSEPAAVPGEKSPP
ncbi:MAG: hypothetical protein HYS13_01095 [Planctomycetia bacterium]|nr:hypothetical protein [Planctomycetia bacterium]